MQKPKQIGKVEVPIYKHGIYVYIGMPDDVQPQEQARCQIVYAEQRINMYFKSIDTHSENIIHEIVHAVDFILFAVGANIDCTKESSEIRAYLTGYIWNRVGTIMHRISKPTLNLTPIVEKAIDLGIEVEKHNQKEKKNSKTQTRKENEQGRKTQRGSKK